MNKTIGYAIAAMAQIAAHRGHLPLSTSAICENAPIPPIYLLRIMGQLVAGGLVVSTRGMQGGFNLAKPANQISLLDICESVERPTGHTALSDRAEADRRQLRALKLDKLECKFLS